MDEVEYRTFWLATGAALCIGGFVVTAQTLTSIAQTGFSATRLAVYIILGFEALAIILGMAAIYGALTGKHLLGYKRVLRHEADLRFIGLSLSAFLAAARFQPSRPLSNTDEFEKWFNALCACVMDVYGKANSVTLLGTVPLIEKSMTVSEVAVTPMRRLQEIIDQQHVLRVRRGFAPDLSRTTPWYEYLAEVMPKGYLN